ncbi:hypothetical protein BC833DRAFT_227469 [Globomyces pollinis-pini]|nr:hypothetical protein BC833DRAFT_227469 [Globomyces pollinis-pini]
MSDKPIRLYCDGVYDLFHIGHMKALEQAKKAFPNVYLMVGGLCNDQLVHAKKGPTVLTDKERYESVRHCKWVDEVIEDAPWVVTMDFINKHQIDYVAHDDIPYADDGATDVYAMVKSAGKFHATQRTEGISTSDLIGRVVKNYELYLERNIKRGIVYDFINILFRLYCCSIKHYN